MIAGRKLFERSNDGLWLEKQLAVTNAAYLEAGIAKIEKVAPPTKYLRKGAQLSVISLRNPFLDFIGSARGRMVCMEAKSTMEPKLTLLHDGGITNRQWDALVDWERRGKAMCCVVWGHKGEIRFLSMRALEARLADGVKHMRFEMAEPIAQGAGYILNDWLLNLIASYGYETSKK